MIIRIWDHEYRNIRPSHARNLAQTQKFLNYYFLPIPPVAWLRRQTLAIVGAKQWSCPHTEPGSGWSHYNIQVLWIYPQFICTAVTFQQHCKKSAFKPKRGHESTTGIHQIDEWSKVDLDSKCIHEFLILQVTIQRNLHCIWS